MAVIQGRTRKEIRQSVGYNLGSIYVSTATGGSTSTVVDTALTTVVGGDNDHIGKWIVFTSGALDGTIVRVTDYNPRRVPQHLDWLTNYGMEISLPPESTT